MANALAFLAEAGIDTETGIAYTGNQEKFVSALQRYYRASEKNLENIQEFLRTEDLENYMITVHALKSNSKMIGALVLSSSFEALETAARVGDLGFLKEQTPSAVESYKALITALAPIGQAKQIIAAGEISGEEAGRVASQLLQALDDFEDELSAQLAEKLSGYPFRLSQKEKLEKAKEYIADFSYEEAEELVREIVETIE